MAFGSQSTSRARRLAHLALLGLVTAVIGVGSGAFARSEPSARSGRAAVRITSGPVRGLYPGAVRKLALVLRNRTGHRVRVQRLRVRLVGTSRRGCLPTPRNLRIRQVRRRVVNIPAHARRRVVVRLTMPMSVANACQRALFKLSYSARIRSGPG